MPTILGSSRNDIIEGAPGASISAGAGDDQIYVRFDAETVTGGAGSDVLIVAPGASRAAVAGVNHPENLAHFTDWSTADILVFAGGPDGGAQVYKEVTATSFDDAEAQANALLPDGSPAGYLVAQVGGDVIAFYGHDEAVVLDNRTLNDIAPANIHANIPLFTQSPGGLNGGSVITVSGDAVANLNLVGTQDLPVVAETVNELLMQSTAQTGGVTYHPVVFDLHGFNLAYDGSGDLFSGTISSITLDVNPAPGTTGGFQFTASGFAIGVSTLSTWIGNNDTTSLTSAIFGGDDLWKGSVGADVMQGLDGNDTLNGFGGPDTIFGGTGDDVIFGADSTGAGDPSEQNYLRGDEGDDSISGGSGFDDANGNMGNDTIHGNGGDDWSVGGKDNDVLFGDDGGDVVWGNLGADTCDGGNGADQVRGGQGDDSVSGGAGDDFVSGDRGNDTVSGGAGADLFHGSQDAGIDRVLDFHIAEGDRVMLDPGTIFTVTQVGADTVIDMGAIAGQPNQMILVGVQMSTLIPGWIFGA